MNWDKFDIHLENLIPGMALLSLMAHYWPLDLTTYKDHVASVGIAFVALSYLAGAVGNILARMLLDPVSSKTIRTPLIRLLAHQKIKDLNDKSKDALNKHYSFLIDSAMICGNDSVVKEVLKRRQTGRLCRSALIPVLLIVSQMASGIGMIALLAGAYVFMLLLYAYSEVATFTEAYRGYRILDRTSETNREPETPNKSIQGTSDS
ncbi:MAG: hypothetical protein H8D23_22185 [Candidatus Brocadiales bacterium]|nr:hypothetical protein [Candidatus Brocadiales bacterium]